jgi:hypothetical protein
MVEFAAMLGPKAAADVLVVDITDNDDLERRYAAKIPVLTADDEFVCAYRLDPDRITPYLGD